MYKDTSDSSEAHNSEAPDPSGHFASNLAMIGAVEVLQHSTQVSRSHFFPRILLHFIGFVSICCTSRAFTIGIYTVNLGKGLGSEKNDFSRHRLSKVGLRLVQSLQGRTQNDRTDQELHYCEPRSNPRCLYTLFPLLNCLRRHNSRYYFELSTAFSSRPFNAIRIFREYGSREGVQTSHYSADLSIQSTSV